MIDWTTYLLGCGLAFGLAFGGWGASLVRNNVSIVDTLWSLMFLVITGTCYFMADEHSTRSTLVLVLVSAWAVRLSVHITLRSIGEEEDHRYQEIRNNNEPGFRFKSLYIVFGLQALLACVIAIPLAAAQHPFQPFGGWDMAGLALWGLGMFFEVTGDYQLTRFKQDPNNRGKVLETGLWRYTRHPNYFGECLIWWGYFMLAVAAGGWWTLFSPLLMTFLLLKVSGVSLLEKDISTRRPAYSRYIRQTNAFIPGPRRRTREEP